jgi:HAE1 family hydrophobic/amphiphilic exporter-1
MLTATVLAVFFVPIFYVAIQSLIELKNGPPKPRPGQVIHAPLEAAPLPENPPPAAPLPPPPTKNGPDGAPPEGRKPPATPEEKASK